ncbi:PspA/IM30 family protein [Deinococcus sp.]|uniref:PspA/IM30 family protein n=1 Tax=Deinococcus sp. TaxID=47478 RepID=UPI0025E88C8A|nr:PspA/IM30 family protein [Deinococcus sp.]
MSILDRLSRLLRANVNDLISKAEDPSLIIEQTLRDMRGAYGEARTEVAGSMAQQAKLEREATTNRRLSEEYGKKAEEALRGGSEELAREALRRKQNYLDLAAGFDDQLKLSTSNVDQLKTQLRALEAKIDEMESKQQLLLARHQTAKATETLEKASGFDRAGGAMNAFEDMERKVAAQEDKARAMGQLREEGDIDAQLANLGRGKAIDDEFEALKLKIQGSEQPKP